jgi:hypothetical protein
MDSHCASRAQATACRRTQPAPSGRWAACTRGTSCASHGSGRSTTRGISRRDATPWLTCHAKPPTKVWQVGSLRASVRHAEVTRCHVPRYFGVAITRRLNVRRSLCYGYSDSRALNGSHVRHASGVSVLKVQDYLGMNVARSSHDDTSLSLRGDRSHGYLSTRCPRSVR